MSQRDCGRRGRIGRIGALVAIAIVAALAASPGAAASGSAGSGDPQGYVEDVLYYGLFYENVEAGIVVTAGTSLEGFCPGGTPGTAPLRVFERQDGTDTLKVRGEQDVPLYVYEFAGSAPALVGMACEAVLDDDPTTNPPEPWAAGQGLLTFTITGIEGPDDMGGFSVANAINGRVVAGDGSEWKVLGSTSFDMDESGAPIGDPAEFQSVSIQRIGPA